MTDFRVSDLCDVFGVEGLCYEYWWASAVMRSIGKGLSLSGTRAKTPPSVTRIPESTLFALFSMIGAIAKNEEVFKLASALG